MGVRSTRRFPSVVAAGLATTAIVGGVLAASAPAGAQGGQCKVTISATQVPVGTNVTIDVTGFDPNEPFTIVQTHNGSASQGSGNADNTGAIHSDLPYAAGTWMDEWTGQTSGVTCSVSWTVGGEATTTTTEAPTTTAPATTSTAAPVVAATATPKYTG